MTAENKETFDAWIHKNGLRWTAEGGPLAPGGVDIAFIDDPQMPGTCTKPADVLDWMLISLHRPHSPDQENST